MLWPASGYVAFLGFCVHMGDIVGASGNLSVGGYSLLIGCLGSLGLKAISREMQVKGADWCAKANG